MKKLVVTAFLATMSLAAIPASAMTAAPGVTTGPGLAQDIAYGCGRGYHPNSYGRCVPNGNYGYRAPYHQGYYYRPGYGHSTVPRQGCPRGMHPGNSGRCVNNY